MVQIVQFDGDDSDLCQVAIEVKRLFGI
jgi:hypothetical protein